VAEPFGECSALDDWVEALHGVQAGRESEEAERLADDGGAG